MNNGYATFFFIPRESLFRKPNQISQRDKIWIMNVTFKKKNVLETCFSKAKIEMSKFCAVIKRLWTMLAGAMRMCQENWFEAFSWIAGGCANM